MDERTRKILDQEKNPEILRGLIDAILKDNAHLRSVITDLEKKQAEENQAHFNIEEQVKILRRGIFGKSSESRFPVDRPRDKSQTEALLFSQSAFPAEVSIDDKKKNKWADLPVKEIEHHFSDAELNEEASLRGIANPQPSMWKNTGLYDKSFRIEIVERSYIKEIHKKFKYKLNNNFNSDSEKEVIITANGSSSLLPGMNYSTNFVVSVVADKYISHMPLERQTREMESLGLKGIKNSTLSRMAGLAAASLEPVQSEILKLTFRS